ncbi:hypothetical protein KVT40_002735 [Elsinoe batatas]|uniref:Uncharacterized protein n=1 Tax=Elsinoe batatas TaxID=2601811 RepID=A0A8K0L7F3_9PEZI|nr:hypothetical protein KVT40_002735 [Elsinoe batatas]
MLILEVLLCASQGIQAVQRARDEIHSQHPTSGRLGQAMRCMTIIQRYFEAIGDIPQSLDSALIRLMGVTGGDLDIDDLLKVIRKSPLCVYIGHRRSWTYACHNDTSTDNANSRCSSMRRNLAKIGCWLLSKSSKHDQNEQCRMTWQARLSPQYALLQLTFRTGIVSDRLHGR